MIEHKVKHSKELTQNINFIITSTHHATYDEKVRQVIGTSISRALNMSKVRGGNIDAIEDTVMYRLAATLKSANSFDEFKTMIKHLHNYKKPLSALTAFGLKWKTKFPLPDEIKDQLKPKRIVKDIPDVKVHKMDNEMAAMYVKEIETALTKELDKPSYEKLEARIIELEVELKLLHDFVSHHVHRDILSTPVAVHYSRIKECKLKDDKHNAG